MVMLERTELLDRLITDFAREVQMDRGVAGETSPLGV